MITSHINKMKGGWFIGNFDPSFLKTEQFEVGVRLHKQGEEWPKHYHKESIEYNLLVYGKMKVCGQEITTGTLFSFEKNEVADPVFLEDCYVVTIKVPSVPGDKWIV